MRQQLSTTPAPTVSHTDMANAIRFLSIDAVEAANSGHPGMPMGMADVATVLFRDVLRFAPYHPEWPNRDRFVLSAGHGSMLLYALLYLTGSPGMELADLKRFRQLGAKTAGHPEHGHAAGIETTTGPLGQGVANAVGMALSQAMMAARFGAVMDHYIYTVVGDGCLMEGISHEALSLAGHLGLHKLIVLWDDNGISIDGSTSLTVSEDTLARMEAYGFATARVDGHDERAILRAIEAAKASDKPSFIACKTVIGYGAPTKGGTEKTHGSPLGKDEVAATREKLGWKHAPFEIPASILNAWREAGARGEASFAQWSKQFDAMDSAKRAEFERLMAKELPANFADAVMKLKTDIATRKPTEATRKSSENTLNALVPVVPELIGGSADLTGSNNTKAKPQNGIAANNFSGSYIYYGVREHAMGAIMNGLALSGAFIPYGGTFLVFSDYCKPAIRLSALMKQRVIYVMTHDSIGLGEDGPTHQPIEHLASLRAIPNLLVFRPADAMETAECWALALSSMESPSLLSLTRQNLPAVRLEATKENLCARGGYVLSESRITHHESRITLIATGSEVSLALDVQKALEAKNIGARVVSMPCTQLFDEQPKAYRESVLPRDAFKVSIEAGSTACWHKYVGNGIVIGIDSFGASAPAEDLFHNFGLTVEQIVERIEGELREHRH